jgi:hypothetical protein
MASTTCPLHPTVALAPLPRSRETCDACRRAGAVAVVGCRFCGYGVCKWCNIGGHALFERIARAEAALAEARAEVVAVKARVDGDVFVWV